MGAMVIDELCSAYCDPEEFYKMAVGDTFPSLDRTKQIHGIIDKAAEFGGALIPTTDALRERQLV